jgi:hypothetical protein
MSRSAGVFMTANDADCLRSDAQLSVDQSRIGQAEPSCRATSLLLVPAVETLSAMHGRNGRRSNTVNQTSIVESAALRAPRLRRLTIGSPPG